MWVLTKSVNDYNQYGDYLVTVFNDKPTPEKLRKTLSIPANEGDEFINHLLNGGGRIGVEYEWYLLTKLEEGEEYKER